MIIMIIKNYKMIIFYHFNYNYFNITTLKNLRLVAP